MTDITATMVRELRERTGTGIMECKKALVEANGNIELAIDNMRILGQMKAAKKSSYTTAEGVILAAVTDNFGILIELNCETDFVAKDTDFLDFGRKIITMATVEKITDVDALKAKCEDQRISLIARIGENINIRRLAALESKNLGYYLHGTRIGVLVSATSTDKKLLKHIAMHVAACKPEYVKPEDVPTDVVMREHQIQLNIALQSGKTREIIEKIVQSRMNKFISEVSLTGQNFIMDLNQTVGQLLKEKGAEVIDFIRFEVGEGIEKVKSNFSSEISAISPRCS